MIFLASVGFRLVHVRGSGTVTQSSNAEIPGNIRTLGGDLDIFSFRGFPCASAGFRSVHVRGSGAAARSSYDASPENIRRIWGLGYF